MGRSARQRLVDTFTKRCFFMLEGPHTYPVRMIDDNAKHIFRTGNQEADHVANLGTQKGRNRSHFTESTTQENGQQYVVVGIVAKKEDGRSGCRRQRQLDHNQQNCSFGKSIHGWRPQVPACSRELCTSHSPPRSIWQKSTVCVNVILKNPKHQKLKDQSREERKQCKHIVGEGNHHLWRGQNKTAIVSEVLLILCLCPESSEFILTDMPTRGSALVALCLCVCVVK